MLRVYFAGRLRPAPPPDPQRRAVVLAPQFEDCSFFVRSRRQQRERIVEAALSLRGIRKKRASQQPCNLFGLDAKSFHDGAIGAENTCVA